MPSESVTSRDASRHAVTSSSVDARHAPAVVPQIALRLKHCWLPSSTCARESWIAGGIINTRGTVFLNCRNHWVARSRHLDSSVRPSHNPTCSDIQWLDQRHNRSWSPCTFLAFGTDFEVADTRFISYRSSGGSSSLQQTPRILFRSDTT